MTAAHTFGSVLRGRSLRGLSVEEVVMPAGLAVPEHGHEGAQIYFLLEGAYEEVLRGRRHELRPGAAWFRPPREPHANAVLGAGDALTLIVTIEPARLAASEAGGATGRALHSILLDEIRAELLREIRRGDPASIAALEGWSLLLLSRAERLLATGASAAPEWLADAVAFVERACSGPLSLSAVAAAVGVHPATLAAAFRRVHGTSVGEHIREVRLRRARAWLLETRRPLKQIAADAGFFDQAHLGRCFRRRFGMAPAAFRRCARGGSR